MAEIEITDVPEEFLWDIMDKLDIEDIFNLGQTSVLMKDYASNYIQHTMQNKHLSIKCKKNQLRLSPPERKAAKEFSLKSIKNITIHGFSELLLRFVSANFPNGLTKIKFKNMASLAEPSSDELQCLQNTLSNTSVIEINCIDLNGKSYDALLRFAKNMQELIIIDNSVKSPITKIAKINVYKNKWPYMNYPNLKTIQWDDGIANHQNQLCNVLSNNQCQLCYLLSNNKMLRNIKVARNISAAINFVADKNLKLNILHLTLNSFEKKMFPLICGQLRALSSHNYKKLVLKFAHNEFLEEHIDDLVSLRALEKIIFEGKYIMTMNRLINLREIYINNLEDGTEASKQLKLIEILRIKECSFHAIVPFIRNSVILKEIVIEEVYRESLPNIDALDRQRKPFRTLSLYLDSWAYVKLKTYTTTRLTVRRYESFISTD